MSEKFKVNPASKRHIRREYVNAHLPADIRDRFFDLCEETGQLPSRVAAQCIRYALDHME